MNNLSLNNGTHLYLGDYNIIINSEIKDHFLTHATPPPPLAENVPIGKENIKSRVTGINQISFEVTQTCQLNCKYCIFGSAYPHQRRNSSKTMNPETARKGLDYIYSLVKDRQDRSMSFSFYGGEPLLNFSLIKEIVLLTRERFRGWELSYYITSNLTSLEDHVLDFLVENNFKLNVSLDGPKEIHDAKRVFHNGNGSFDRVIENLEKIKRRNPGYYSKVSFNAVYSGDMSIEAVYRFFTGDQRVNGQDVNISSVNKYDSEYYDKFPTDREQLENDYGRVWALIREKKSAGKELTPFEQFLLERLNVLASSMASDILSPLANSCVFDSKIHIDARGGFHACEKINDKFSYGDVDNGLDYERMEQILSCFIEANREYCSKCGIRYLCKRCFATLGGDGHFKPDPQVCGEIREGVILNLERYIKLRAGGII